MAHPALVDCELHDALLLQTCSSAWIGLCGSKRPSHLSHGLVPRYALGLDRLLVHLRCREVRLLARRVRHERARPVRNAGPIGMAGRDQSSVDSCFPDRAQERLQRGEFRFRRLGPLFLSPRLSPSPPRHLPCPPWPSPPRRRPIALSAWAHRLLRVGPHPLLLGHRGQGLGTTGSPSLVSRLRTRINGPATRSETPSVSLRNSRSGPKRGSGRSSTYSPPHSR